jgi:flavorubredoxin
MTREIVSDVFWVGAVDFHCRLFDALVPTPDGTSYNAYLVRGKSATALIDTVEPDWGKDLLANLAETGLTWLDYIVVNHAEQDHSGAIPAILERYPGARIVTNEKCKDQLIQLFALPPECFKIIKDRETLDLGDKTLEFIMAPWVHWPETMFTYLREEKVLFSCDFLGSHLATSNLFVDGIAEIYEPAKRYYAEIMMPFRNHIQRHLDKLAALEIAIVAPSHGPIHRQPQAILDFYREWSSDKVKNEVVIPFVSMHGSTERMVSYLSRELIKRQITVKPFDMTKTDLGKLAIAMVDTATIVFATPAVLLGPHPTVVYAAYLTNVLKPKVKHIAFMGSFGWGGKTADTLMNMLDQLKVDFIPPVFVKGAPKDVDMTSLARLADDIETRHRALSLL